MSDINVLEYRFITEVCLSKGTVAVVVTRVKDRV